MKSLTQVHPSHTAGRGNPALRDTVAKMSGKEGLRFEGKAIVFEGEEKALQAILKGTVKKMPDDERREKVELLLSAATKHISLTAIIKRRATEFQKWNTPPLDALHLASAEAARANCFLTTDDYLIRRAHRHADELKAKVENPAKWLIQEATDES